MKIDDERKLMVMFFMQNHDLILNEYKNEVANFSCKCGKNFKLPFSFILNKAKRGSICTCGITFPPTDIEIYTYENFIKNRRIMIEENKKRNKERKEFLDNEKFEMSKFLIKNRKGKIIRVLSGNYKKYEFVCTHEHSATILTFNELLEGQWCTECEEQEINFFKNK